MKMDRLAGHLSFVGVILSSVSVLLMVVFISVNVVLRKMAGFAFLFVEEYSGYLLVLITYLSLAYALRKGKHIHMDLIVSKIPQRLRDYIETTNSFLCLIVLFFLLVKMINFCYFSFEFRIRSDSQSQSIMWPLHFLVPLGLALFILEMSNHFIRLLSKLIKGDNI